MTAVFNMTSEWDVRLSRFIKDTKAPKSYYENSWSESCAVFQVLWTKLNRPKLLQKLLLTYNLVLYWDVHCCARIIESFHLVLWTGADDSVKDQTQNNSFTNQTLLQTLSQTQTAKRAGTNSSNVIKSSVWRQLIVWLQKTWCTSIAFYENFMVLIWSLTTIVFILSFETNVQIFFEH